MERLDNRERHLGKVDRAPVKGVFNTPELVSGWKPYPPRPGKVPSPPIPKVKKGEG